MKIEIGQRFRYRPLGPESIWVVERLLQTPGAITHVTIKREGAARDTKTYSEAALRDKSAFEPVAEATK
jgi:hypothetical protein